jgi:hypothetical protein
MTFKSNSKPPWKTPKPKVAGKQKLSAEEIALARERASKAGRRYPNLVDNMAVLKLRKTKENLP